MYRQSYEKDPALLDRVFVLLDRVFQGIAEHVKRAGPLGLDWGETSTPFLRIENGRVVSHVGVLSLPLVVEGRLVTAAGIHAVCTHPDYRGRGYYRAVMAEAMDWCDRHFELALLFTDTPKLYEPFGFRVVPESRFVLDEAASADHDKPPHAALRQLNWDSMEDVALLRRLLRGRVPVSTKLGVVREESVFAFNAVNLSMWHAAGLDAIISLTNIEGVVRIHDVVAETMPTWPKLARCLPVDARQIELCFCPDGFGLESIAKPCAIQSDDCFMVRSEFMTGDRPIMFPRTAEC